MSAYSYQPNFNVALSGKLSTVNMTVTPDDSIHLQRLGIVLLQNIARFTTITLLYGNNDAIYRVDALTQTPPCQAYL